MHETPPEREFPVAGLLRWYRKHRRDLPWRARKLSKTRPARRVSPYETLVSEQMCQQTQVATVIPFYHRFLEAFPTVEALAAADEQHVLKQWQGLGYYRRARNLHATAKIIVTEFGGELPNDAETLLKLPGVGRYTAGAVASIAFDRPAPVLDGNVMRVLARHDGIADPVDATPTQKRLWARAEQLVARSPRNSRGDFNQALMELGATVCTPQPGSAKCMFCPLRESCDASATGRVDLLPVKNPKRTPTAVTHRVVVIEKSGRCLFEQRPAKGLWSKMWQLPTREAETASKDAADLVDWIAERFALRVSRLKPTGRFQHATTHRAITFEVYRSVAVSGRLRPKSGIWRRLDRIDDLPLPKPQLTAITMIRKPDG